MDQSISTNFFTERVINLIVGSTRFLRSPAFHPKPVLTRFFNSSSDYPTSQLLFCPTFGVHAPAHGKAALTHFLS